MTIIRCLKCSRVINVDNIGEWHKFPHEQIGPSSHQSLRKGLCQRCFNGGDKK